MPVMDRVIESCAYNRDVPIASFRYKNYGVIMHSRDMVINNAGDEASAIEVINFLKDIVTGTGNLTGK